MIQIIYCDGCGESGALPVQLTYQYKHERCSSCGDNKINEFTYYFCSLNCLAPFIKDRFNLETSTLTLPCRIEWAHLLNNAECPACRGKKYVE